MKKDYKIGAQILSPTMMECSFYHTDAVLKTIESIRETASKTHEAFSNKLREAPNEALLDARGYNNAISILGSRGSGKTSIIMTLQHILQVGESEWRAGKAGDQVRPENIIMPILMPQDFSDGQSLLSWVIIKLQELAKSVLERIKSSGCGYYLVKGITSGWAVGEQTTPYNTLQEYIDNLTASCELRFRNEYRLETMRNDEIYHYMDSVERDSKLVLDMLRLISQLVDCYRFSGNAGSTSAKEPLIFFVIDDLDMAPQRSHEVLNLVLRYLQHPNVVVLCGWNQELFQNHLCIELLRTQGVLNVNSADKNYGFDDVFTMRQRKRVSALDSARRLAMDNLKKAFPPAQRFEIRGLTTKQRAEFPLLSENELPTDPRDFFALIENTLLYSRKRQPQEEDHVRFLYNENMDRLYIYMRIFDNKCRGMINICKAFEALREKLILWDHCTPLNLTKDLLELLNTILFSTTRFAPYRRGIRDLISIYEITLTKDGGNSDYYCNYKAVEDVLSHYKNRVEVLSQNHTFGSEYIVEHEYCYFPSLAIDVYLLLGFMENLLRYIVNNPPVMHGGHEFSKVLNQINPPIEIEPESDNRVMRAIAAAGIQRISLFPDTKSFNFNVRLLDSYEKQRFSDGQYHFSGSNTLLRLFDAVINLGVIKGALSFDALKGIYSQDPQWFAVIIDVLRASRATKDNILRLIRFTSFQAQNTFSDYSDFARIATRPVSQSFDDILRNDSYLAKDITDEELRDLVFCLRETDKIRRDLSAYQTIRVAKSNFDPESLSSTVKKARFYYEIMSKYEINPRSRRRWITPSQYKQSLAIFRSQKTDNTIRTIDDSVVSMAKVLSDESINLLMFNLRRRLEIAVRKNYEQQKSMSEKYQYLLKAATAVTEYQKEWNLIDYGWTEEDAEAAKDLLVFLRENHMAELYSIARRVSLYGPELSASKRELYTSAVDEIKARISSRLSSFSDSDKRRIKHDLQVLTAAPSHVRRALIIENDISDLLIEFWYALVDGAANLAIDLWEAGNNNPVVWPIEGNSRNIIESWYKKLESLIHSPTNSSNPSNLVDVKHGPQKALLGGTRFDSLYLL